MISNLVSLMRSYSIVISGDISVTIFWAMTRWTLTCGGCRRTSAGGTRDSITDSTIRRYIISSKTLWCPGIHHNRDYDEYRWYDYLFCFRTFTWILFKPPVHFPFTDSIQHRWTYIAFTWSFDETNVQYFIIRGKNNLFLIYETYFIRIADIDGRVR